MSYKQQSPLPVEEGGIEIETLVLHGVLMGNTVGPVQVSNPGTNGQVFLGSTGAFPAFGTLTSSGGTITFTPGPSSLNLEVNASSVVTSITGTTNQITASASVGNVTLSTPVVFIAPGSSAAVTTVGAGTNFLMPTTTSLAGQIIQNGSRLFHTYGGTNNLFLGFNTGNFTLSGDNNLMIGINRGSGLTTGFSNVNIGGSGPSITSGNQNVFVGSSCGNSVTTGSNNTLIGTTTASNLISGSNNILIGCGDTINAGSNYTTESSNILIGSAGTASDAFVMRLGTSGSSTAQVNKAFIAGIYNTAIGATTHIVSIDSDGQLGFVSGAGAVTSIIGTANQITASSPTGNVTLTIPSTFIAPGSIAATTSITATLGDVVITAGNLTLPASNAAGTNGIIKLGGSNFMHSLGTGNTFLGQGAGNLALTTANAQYNTGLGQSILSALTTGVSNVGIGAQSLLSLQSGTQNVAIGVQALVSLVSGSANMVLGNGSGSAYTTNESNNIILGANITGTAAESGVTRIGASQSKAFITGIYNVAIGATNHVVSVDSTGQLGLATNPQFFTWTTVTGTSQALAVNNGYVMNNAGVVTGTLPATAVVGDRIEIAGLGSGGWAIAQNSGQLVHLGSSVTSTGVGGSLASTNRYDSVTLICIVTNTTWTVRGPVGNITVV